MGAYTLSLEVALDLGSSSLSESESDESLESLGVGFLVGFATFFALPVCRECDYVIMKRYERGLRIY